MTARPLFLKNRSNVLVLFLVSGMLTSYFDFLTYPLVVLCFPLVIYVFQQRALGCDGFLMILGFITVWLVGYLGMWMPKWLLAACVTGQDVIVDAMNRARFRISTLWGDGAYEFSLSEMGRRLMRHFKPIAVGLPLCSFMLVCSIDLIRKTRVHSVGMGQSKWFIGSFVLIALLPIVWLLVLKNHSMIHDYMSFKTLSGSIFAVTTRLAFLAYRDPMNMHRVNTCPSCANS